MMKASEALKKAIELNIPRRDFIGKKGETYCAIEAILYVADDPKTCQNSEKDWNYKRFEELFGFNPGFVWKKNDSGVPWEKIVEELESEGK